MIPYGKHFIDEDDIDAVVKILRHGSLTQGPAITSFEQAFCDYVGVKYAVAVSSCTAGLHIASLAAGLGSGDTLITSPISFVASANAGLYAGANVAFADINPHTVNMDVQSLREFLVDNPSTKVAIPVHFAGLPCDMESIKAACDESSTVVIEDAAHALGASYKNGKRVGSCCHSLMTVFSLHPVKAIAAGEGGVVTTNDETIYRKLLRLRSHGINKLDDKFENIGQAFSDGIQNSWYYEMQQIGFHYRTTDIQCALAQSQLKKLDQFIEKRRSIASIYRQRLANFSSVTCAQPSSDDQFHARHLFVIRSDYKRLKASRAVIQNTMRSEFGIITQVHYLPIPMHPYYQKLGHNMNNLPNALSYYEECLSIPIYYSLTDDELEHVILSLSKVFN